VVPVTWEARVGYAEAHKIEPTHQRIIERQYACLTLDDIDPANAVSAPPDTGIDHGYDTAKDIHAAWNFPEAACGAAFTRLGQTPRPSRSHYFLPPLTALFAMLTPSPESWLLSHLHPALSFIFTLYTLQLFLQKYLQRRTRTKHRKRKSPRRKRYGVIVSSGTGKSYLAKRNYDVVDDDSLYRHRLPADKCLKCLTRKFKPLSRREYRFTDPRSPWGVYLTRKWTYQREALDGRSEQFVLVHSAAQARFLGLKIVAAFYLNDNDIQRVARTNNRHSLKGMFEGRRNLLTEAGSHARVCIPYGTLDAAIRLHATWLPPTPKKFGL
jgi:hypothetical protein